jgi:predicted nuclease of predicted toxin-antitoxin system
VVTKDTDLLLISEAQGFPPRLIWTGLGNCSSEEVEALLRNNYDRILALDQDPDRGGMQLL